MIRIALLILTIFLKTCIQLPPVSCGEITDSIHLNSQAMVDSFQSTLPIGCTIYKGELQIAGADIKNLQPLDFLKEVGKLYIYSNLGTNTIKGFKNLERIETNLDISNFDKLESIDAFPNLRTVKGEIYFTSNIKLSSIKGFEKLDSIGRGLTFSGNKLLTDLPSFNALKSINIVQIIRNSSLVKISGFDRCVEIKEISIKNNIKLKTLDGFANLVNNETISIDGNDELSELLAFSKLTSTQYLKILNQKFLREITTFKKLENINVFLLSNNKNLANITNFEQLKSIGSRLDVINNPNLGECCGLFNALQHSTWLKDITITNNIKSCNSKDEIIMNGKCK